MADHIYHWKHGWIPLDHFAALKKAHGSAATAARLLAASRGRDAGIRNKTDVAKAALRLHEIPDAGDRHKAMRQVQEAAARHGVKLPASIHPKTTHAGNLTPDKEAHNGQVPRAGRPGNARNAGGVREGSRNPARNAQGAGRTDRRGHPHGVQHGLLVRGRPVRTVNTLADNSRSKTIRAAGNSTPTLYELDAKTGAQTFHDAMTAALKDNPHRASVYVYPVDEYKHMRLFLTQGGMAGVALHGDEIVSVFKSPDSPDKKVARHLISTAVAHGGRRLDAFDTVLPSFYASEGFVTKARLPWDDAQAPKGWNPHTFSGFNNGHPDVVFMQYDPHALDRTYTPGEGPQVGTYTAGLESTAHTTSATVAHKFGNKPLSEPALHDILTQTADESSAAANLNADRTDFTDARKQLHTEFIQASLRGVTRGRKKKYTMMGGGPASGKSSVIKSRRGTPDALDTNRVTVNADIAKTGGADEGRPDIVGLRDDFQGRIKAGDLTGAASYVHEESSVMSKKLNSAALEQGLSVLNDGVGDGKLKSVLAKTSEARARGYHVEGVYVTADTASAMVRAIVRGYEQERYVNPKIVHNGHTGVSSIFPQLAGDPEAFHHLELHNTDAGAPKLIATADGGKLTIHDHPAYQQFLQKADLTYPVALRQAINHAQARANLTDAELAKLYPWKDPSQIPALRDHLQRAVTDLTAELHDV